MLVLGIESSTPVASVALVSAGGLKGEMTLNTGLTHSEQLLPLIDDLLRQTGCSLDKVEGIAVAGGPGSFTGLRIGMATAKGLAQGRGIPLAGVPTLKALAYRNAAGRGLVSALLNARRQEVYAALFRFEDNALKQVLPACAISPLQWAGKLDEYGEPVVLAGDGAAVYREIWEKVLGSRAVFLPPVFSIASAASVAWLGREKLMDGQSDDLYRLKPDYIRPSEAQVKLEKLK
ncbi:MAG: tRNA (adenosine(37)-N6)-threonylcarbamoyltransferase complex dimerization subunit type 1 TsaB [Peptococcaceae bacterium]|jgi:tRNA threonylcarbamoyladenosine biosynthesis protein TsaB|nr:tRNA (adenosine(37)-N6)-threonylcarbamoyltransferase complex dimerization subunit type 1 TsaB [Peptococcaceae bacterium]MDH7526111.1 tRNA (adenosine(37)-N6)-threonylcarbamoyltransferase complex dimerization subunit type 1 TsaB [Peptococcaceae bacterium]